MPTNEQIALAYRLHENERLIFQRQRELHTAQDALITAKANWEKAIVAELKCNSTELSGFNDNVCCNNKLIAHHVYRKRPGEWCGTCIFCGCGDKD